MFIGATEVLARVRTLGEEEIQPGEAGWLQLEMREPVVAIRGDHYIIRRPSPGETLGGGRVVDPHPKGRHKRFAAGLLERLESLSVGAPEDIFLQSLAAMQSAPLPEVTQRSNLEIDSAQRALENLLDRGEIIILENTNGELSVNSDVLVAARGYWNQISTAALVAVGDYHRAYPLRRGMPKEELKSKLKVSPRFFSRLVTKLIQESMLREKGPLIFQPEHEIRFSAQQGEKVSQLLHQFSTSPYSPPSIKDSKLAVGEDVYRAMVELELLVPVSAEVVFRKQDYDQSVAEVMGLIQEMGAVSAAQVRDHFHTSRRYALALLEHLDELGVTVRQGDVRKLK